MLCKQASILLLKLIRSAPSITRSIHVERVLFSTMFRIGLALQLAKQSIRTFSFEPTAVGSIRTRVHARLDRFNAYSPLTL